jgi:hypothetical protein
MKLRAIPPMENAIQQKSAYEWSERCEISGKSLQLVPRYSREGYIALLLNFPELVTDRNKYCIVYGACTCNANYEFSGNSHQAAEVETKMYILLQVKCLSI